MSGVTWTTEGADSLEEIIMRDKIELIPTLFPSIDMNDPETRADLMRRVLEGTRAGLTQREAVSKAFYDVRKVIAAEAMRRPNTAPHPPETGDEPE
jgi:hypothetical protein